MGLVVLGHSENGNLSDRPFLADDTPRSFVHRRKVGVQIAGITAPAGHFLAGGGHFAERFGIVCYVRRDDQHVHIFLERQIFRGGERHSRGGYTFDCGVIREVDEHHRTFYGSRAPEVRNEEIRFLERDTDCGEHDCELAVRASHLRLTRNLRRKFRVGQTRHREHGKFLPANEGIKPVDCADSRLNEFVGIIARNGVYGLPVDVESGFGNDRRAAVARTSHTVEHPAQHILGHGKFYASAEKTRFRRGHLYALSGLEQLHEGLVAVDFEHLAASDFAVLLPYLHEFVVLDALHALDEHKRTDDFPYGSVFLKHHIPPSSESEKISFLISAVRSSNL